MDTEFILLFRIWRLPQRFNLTAISFGLRTKNTEGGCPVRFGSVGRAANALGHVWNSIERQKIPDHHRDVPLHWRERHPLDRESRESLASRREISFRKRERDGFH